MQKPPSNSGDTSRPEAGVGPPEAGVNELLGYGLGVAGTAAGRRGSRFWILRSAEFGGKLIDASNPGLPVAWHGRSALDWVQSKNRRLTRSPHGATGEPIPRRLSQIRCPPSATRLSAGMGGL